MNGKEMTTDEVLVMKRENILNRLEKWRRGTFASEAVDKKNGNEYFELIHRGRGEGFDIAIGIVKGEL